jgi:hypothetical protein
MADSPDTAARLVSAVRSRRRVRDKWRDRRSGGIVGTRPIWLCEAITRDQTWIFITRGSTGKRASPTSNSPTGSQTYMDALKNDGLMQGWRLMRRKLGLSAVGEFHLMMEFSDLAQFDSAFSRVGSRREPIEGVHFGGNSLVANVQFGLYRDFPDSIRHRGDEKF